MTQTLIEQLEKLIRTGGVAGIFRESSHVVLSSDLRAIIEQHRHAVPTQEELEQEIYAATGLFIPFVVMEWMLKRYYPSQNIVSELVKALDDDAYAATFQSVAGYRTALIAKVKGMVG